MRECRPRANVKNSSTPRVHMEYNGTLARVQNKYNCRSRVQMKYNCRSRVQNESDVSSGAQTEYNCSSNGVLVPCSY